MKTQFSKYFEDEINEHNWEAVANEDGTFDVVDEDESVIASGIDFLDTAVLIANAQRLIRLFDGHMREVIRALMIAETNRFRDALKQLARARGEGK